MLHVFAPICAKKIVTRGGEIGSGERIVALPHAGAVLLEMHNEMSKKTKEQILARLRRRYATAGLQHKSKLLDQAVELLGYHRKAVIRALGARPSASAGPKGVWGRP